MFIDVTQPLYSGMPKVGHLPEPSITPLTRLEDDAPLATTLLSIASHVGTHIDAPSHAIRGGKTIDQLLPEQFFGPGVVVTIRRSAGEMITVEDIAKGGPDVQPGDMVLLDTGWADYFGTDDYYDHPSLDPEAAEWLVAQGVSLLAVDNLTPDLAYDRRPDGFDFPVHRQLLGNDILIAENLASLQAVTGQRVNVYAFPLLVRGGDAGHVRFLVTAE